MIIVLPILTGLVAIAAILLVAYAATYILPNLLILFFHLVVFGVIGTIVGSIFLVFILPFLSGFMGI